MQTPNGIRGVGDGLDVLAGVELTTVSRVSSNGLVELSRTLNSTPNIVDA
jgi:hypothetical protein